MAGVMIKGKQKKILYENEKELKRSLRVLRAYNTKSDPFHAKAQQEISMMGSPLLE